MKRLIPLWITFLGGFVLIFAYFIPYTQSWGEVAAIWFDILAAIAFILGGGNLIKIHLKNISNRRSGWGYSVIVLGTFLLTLYVGLVKVGSPPAPNQEHFGETFVELELDALPPSLIFSVPGSIPDRADAEDLHTSVREQMSEADGQIVFRGWMRNAQKEELLEYEDELEWRCVIERLYDVSQPVQESLEGRVNYYVAHPVVAYRGQMTTVARDALLSLGDNQRWTAAVNQLYTESQDTTEIAVEYPPPLIDAVELPEVISFDNSTDTLAITGPMTPAQRDALLDLFPPARPLSDQQVQAFLEELRSRGSVTPEQVVAFEKILAASWTTQQLIRTLNEAGIPVEQDKTACEMLEEQAAGVEVIDPQKIEGEPVTLNDEQVEIIEEFSRDESIPVTQLSAALGNAGEFTDAQVEALSRFLGSSLTTAGRKRMIAFAMMKAVDLEGVTTPLNESQLEFLLEDYREQVAWRETVYRLFFDAHTVKFSWSGEYRAQGSPFWWLYEYAFKPLQATIFALLAFYVASAAFRAFRAKNMEAVLLLGTAFIILLGRTFAGVFLTGWLPEELSGLRIENLTVYIMQVFNTAGNRAIMIGIALGIASTSLKVLLGVDRSYLGSGEE